MQKLLDTELKNHLEYSKYTHKKEKTNNNSRSGHCEPKTLKKNMVTLELKPLGIVMLLSIPS